MRGFLGENSGSHFLKSLSRLKKGSKFFAGVDSREPLC